jgi:hypothetical protein
MIVALVLVGKMAIYNALLGARWTCTLGTVKYFAAYDVGPGNTLHGRLYGKDESEEEYFGYDAQLKRYWADGADTTGTTEAQTSTDGWTFIGTVNQGGTITKASRVFKITNAHTWSVIARGLAGGKPYEVTATCLRG